MLLRVLAFVLIPCSVVVTREPNCTGLSLRVVSSSVVGGAPAWRVYIQNKTRNSATVRVGPLDYRWTLEKGAKGKWDVVLTGSIGPGKPSAGARPAPELDTTRALGAGQRLVVDEFDLRREFSDGQALTPGASYRITFEQDVELINDGVAVKCKLAAKPRLFRYQPPVN